MYKITITKKDYRTKGGMGFNCYNFINNVIGKTSTWLMQLYKENKYFSLEEQRKYADKLERIVKIINEDE